MEDDNCQSHNFFHHLHESHRQDNVVSLRVDGMMCLGSQEIVSKCVGFYTQLLDVQMCVDDNVKKDGDVFLKGTKNHISHDETHSLDVNILEDKWNMSCYILLIIRFLDGMD